MKRALTVLVAVALLTLALGCALALAQDQQYTLKDYMPETVGSKWTLNTQNQQGPTTVTYEVDKARDIAGQQVAPLLMKNAEGAVMRGSIELVTADNLTLFGTIMVPRGQPGGAPADMLYTPAAVFPGTMKVGQIAQAAVKMTRGGQPVDVTIKVELAAVETVTVPKGAFADCLKIVYTTTSPRGDQKRTVWYAKGVGTVKTEMTGGGNPGAPRVAELTDYQLAP